MSARPLKVEVSGLPFGDCAISSPTRSLEAIDQAGGAGVLQKVATCWIHSGSVRHEDHEGTNHEATKKKSFFFVCLRVFVFFVVSHGR